MKEKSGKDSRVVEWRKKESIFWQKKGGLERLSKVECQIFLSKEIVLGHPCIPRVRVDTGSDKRPGLRKKGRSWREGGGGEGAGTYTRHKGLKQNFM